MKMLNRALALVLVLILSACGGGGGSAGTPVLGAGSSASGATSTVATYSVVLEVDRAAAATTQITSTETVQAVATVTTAAGSPVQGVVVKFSEPSVGLLTFAPVAATALTGADGKASIDLKAGAPANTGATTVQADATINGAAATTSSKSIQITAGAVTPGTPPVPSAINFIGSTPSGTAIVIKGAGGNGRSESAILTFRIVDKANAPIDAAAVDFVLNADSGGATISQTSAVSNSSGQVTVSVASGPRPASIVVIATSHAVPSVSSQSDTLLVSNNVPVAQAFELAAAKYNLDSNKTGDSTTITAFVGDSNGNPVPDGVAVSFQTDLGVVASSTLGGCLTLNGQCTVTYGVQEPRGNGLATVVGTIRVGNGVTLADSLPMHLAGAGGATYLVLDPVTRSPATGLTLSSCKQSFDFLISDGTGHAPAAGTTISQGFVSTGVAVSVQAGTPVPDQIAPGFPPTTFGVQVDLTGTSLVAPCKPTGGVAASANFFNLNFQTPQGIVFTQRIQISYPQ